MVNNDGLDHDQEEQDDEKPTVVVLKEGDLTAEEAESLHKKVEKGIFQLLLITHLKTFW